MRNFIQVFNLNQSFTMNPLIKIHKIHITKNEKQTLMNEQYPVKRTKYVASPFLQLYDVCFTETALETLSKTLVTIGLVQIDLRVLVVRGVLVQPASYYLNLFITRRQQIETSFSCLRR